ncbi:IS66 family insertion sequence element accessory protein TnpA [Candidatus Magnetobacterium casense]|uniref:Transposase n=1 Tax=Candidatus Magnetobacterium casense TaxID=1455061 RepID=A0ABS6S2G6_9BACT|nr:hypothetical protein [Candidatus Magnetobacterium casensis]MBV6343047.1 hypothetical protein [Candidatus Magnetobacterium casensis]
MDEIISESSNKEQKWRRIIAEQGRSGQSIQSFCEARQVNRHSFCYWRKKFCKPVEKDLKVVRPAGRFVVLPSRVMRVSRSPQILLPNGVQIDLGGALESEVVGQFIRKLCGVGHSAKDGRHART